MCPVTSVVQDITVYLPGAKAASHRTMSKMIRWPMQICAWPETQATRSQLSLSPASGMTLNVISTASCRKICGSDLILDRELHNIVQLPSYLEYMRLTLAAGWLCGTLMWLIACCVTFFTLLCNMFGRQAKRAFSD
jgi:hypothetical protein